MSVFKYFNYKDFLKFQIQANKSQRGYQSQMAQAAGCQRPYLSQVIHDEAHLSLEQAVGLSDFWKLNDPETEYLLTLIQYNKSGTSRLRNFLKSKLNRMRRFQESLSQRINQPALDSLKSQSVYYSSWAWSAIHILLTIPGYQSSEAVSQRLNLPLNEVNRIIEGLSELGLVHFVRGKLHLTKKFIHLPKESPMNFVNHSHWRQRALHNISLNPQDSIHYSGVHSLSYDDFEEIKTRILEFLDESHTRIKTSPEEELIFLGMDFFKI